ncbi:MAG: tRNA (adenosine(37)-N6)-threonylcarbamoyltransferase complex dimerization subunit type 1 TsaB, partial [Clostridia bacterium]|nr:tRNA (adenosine(37)-N6)-threonylcarbamoyltransferase complex dimerization subunit type 1 TsaB [Clostridia bacterium]
MKILAIECSAVPVSAAVICDGEVLGYAFSNVKVTHSQTLFPIIESALKSARLSTSDIDTISVATGPGSFTGIRIGISSAKGLAEPKGLKCIGVSTLLAAAYMFLGENAVICPVEDARCGQVYNALFSINGNSVERLCDDRAIMIDELVYELKSLKNNKIILCCDAAEDVIKRLS